MKRKPAKFIRKDFPHTRYYPKFRLRTWHPRGLLNDAFADRIAKFVELEEEIQKAPFNRYTDFSRLTEVRLRIDHFSEFAERRRKVSKPVKSALFADKPVSFFIARLYEMLMNKATIKVRVFRKRKAAAEWLGVPLKILEPPS